MKNNGHIRSQFCTCQDSGAVVTCTKLEPVWIIRMIELELNQTQFSQYFELINWLWNGSFDMLYILVVYILTHWGRDKMDDISQTTFSNAFSWMKMFEYRLKFHWSLFLGVQLTISQHWFRKWLGADQATSHYLDQWWLDYWRIYASLGLNELTPLLRNYNICAYINTSVSGVAYLYILSLYVHISTL